MSTSVLQAHAELWNLTFSYQKSVALETAVSLGVLNAIHSLGDAATLHNLLATVPLLDHRKPYFPRLMRFLAATGIVALDVSGEGGGDEAAGVYRLTPVSRLLVDDDDDGVDMNSMCATRSLSPFVLMQVNKYHVMPSLHLSAWFKGDDGEDNGLLMPAETPFKMAFGMGGWDAMVRDPQFSEVFNAGLASNCQFIVDSVITACGDEVFGGGITSLVDVGGGTGTAARAIAKAFPHVSCSVLDLPTVITGIRQPSGATVKYLAGDMMNYIPPADAVLLKHVLHDWNDEDCIKILTQCKKAICSRQRQTGGGGKVIIIEVVVGSPSKIMFEAQVAIDLLMMVATGGKERDEHEWHKIFMEAGFKHYKIRPAVGFLSVIELYP